MRPNDSDALELRGLVERIKRGDCVLVLGPRIAVRPDDPERKPLEDWLAAELMSDTGAGSTSLRRAADLYLHQVQMREILEVAVRDFYDREPQVPTDFHRDLARLPFRLCIVASPDNLMFNAFQETGKAPQRGHYDFHEASTAPLVAPTAEKPLLYHLFGHVDEASSLVLTEGDLIEFLVAVIRGIPPIPDQVRSILADDTVSFLFLGFGFQNWYLRVLLHVLKVYGRRSKALAFEDNHFFQHPQHDETIGFFGDRQIDFRQLRWEAFASRLRQTYESTIRPAAAPPPQQQRASGARRAVGSRGPKAFVSYASEDRMAVTDLTAQLEARGIDVFQDSQDLRAGDNWDNTLKDVIGRLVNYVVVVQTPAMTRRIEGVFHREIEVALKRQADMGFDLDGQRFRFLIPVRMGDCGVMSSLRHLHAIDVLDPKGIDALAQSIQDDWQRRTMKERPAS